MNCIHEQDYITLFLVFLEFSVCFDMGFLTRGIRLAGYQLRLIIGKTQPAQQGGHPADREMDPEGLTHPARHRGCGRINRRPQMGIQFGELLPIQQRLTTDVVRAQQVVETDSLEPLERVPHRIRIDQQRIDNVGDGTSPPQQDDHVEAVSLTHVTRLAMDML